MSNLEDLFTFSKTDFTRTVRKDVYPAVSPTNPSLSQVGRTVLITGGGDGLGLNIASAFVLAAASTVIITARRPDVLEQAKQRLESEVRADKGEATIIAIPCDVTDKEQVDSLWREINEDRNLTVDVFVSNAARPPQVKPLLDAGSGDIWAQMETNVKGPLYMAERLCAQADKGQKFIVNISVASVHWHTHPAVAVRPGAILSRTASTTLFQLLALEHAHDQVQVVSYHPGLLLNDYFESLGLDKYKERFDSRELAAAFAVWASSKKAAFLHGRFVWASWDVEELSSGAIRQEIDKDPYFLRVGVAPLKGSGRT